jgi:hypothetical protein
MAKEFKVDAFTVRIPSNNLWVVLLYGCWNKGRYVIKKNAIRELILNYLVSEHELLYKH